MSWEKGDAHVLNEIGMAAFEEAIRMAVENRRSQLNMTEQALGTMAFPHVADSRRKVQSIRKGQGKSDEDGNRKPQQLRGTDILNLCESLGLSWKKTIEDAMDTAKDAQEQDRKKAIAR